MDLEAVELRWSELCRADPILSRVELAFPAPLAVLLATVLEAPPDDVTADLAVADDLLQEADSLETSLGKLMMVVAAVLEEHGHDPTPAALAVTTVLRTCATAVSRHYLHEFERLSVRDQLTGLRNRRAFDQDMDGLADRCKRAPDGSAAVVVVDLDGLKAVNDQHGHQAGDEFIGRFARHFDTSTGNAGRAFRWMGDEFAAIFRDATREQAETVMRELEVNPDCPPFSWGLAVIPEDHVEAHEVIKVADAAMYEMKSQRKAAAAS